MSSRCARSITILPVLVPWPSGLCPPERTDTARPWCAAYASARRDLVRVARPDHQRRLAGREERRAPRRRTRHRRVAGVGEQRSVVRSSVSPVVEAWAGCTGLLDPASARTVVTGVTGRDWFCDPDGVLICRSILASRSARALCGNRRMAARLCGIAESVRRSIGFGGRKERVVHTKTATTIGVDQTLRNGRCEAAGEIDDLVETMLVRMRDEAPGFDTASRPELAEGLRASCYGNVRACATGARRRPANRHATLPPRHSTRRGPPRAPRWVSSRCCTPTGSVMRSSSSGSSRSSRSWTCHRRRDTAPR